jgi:glycosyltransferase involved in cell wall biosynthesis
MNRWRPLKKQSPTPKVVVLNPYLPVYRLKFFELVEEKLLKEGINFNLVTGKARKKTLIRGDFSTAPYHIIASQFSVPVFGTRIRFLFSRRLLENASVVVYEFSITNLNTWAAVLFPQRHKVVLWGHGPGYYSRKFWLRNQLERSMARKADMILVYTKPGMDRLIQQGLEPTKLTYLNNTFDWEPLRRAISDLSTQEVENYIKVHKLKDKRVYAFLGALDASKRIFFLSQVLDAIWQFDRNVIFLVAGEGSEKPLLQNAEKRGQLVFIGRVGPREKALLGAVSIAFVNPGNIGLLAVDALVLRRPIFGTASMSSPEKDFLEEGKTLFTLPNTPRLFAEILLSFPANFRDDLISIEIPKVEDFSENFAKSVTTVLKIPNARENSVGKQ